jgi:hypothetical protein
MHPQDRYLMRDAQTGVPVATANTIIDVLAWCWGRDVHAYSLLDYERPVPFCCADLGHLERRLAHLDEEPSP